MGRRNAAGGRGRRSLWVEVTPSEHAHERAGLDFVKKHLPDREPYRAWSNFTFTDSGGGLNEVDLLVITPARVVLVELKGYSGRLEGDAGRWALTSPGRDRPKLLDNPLHLADRKAKKLRSLLERTRAARDHKGRFPYVESAVFLHSPNLDCRLTADGRHHVFGLDPDEGQPPGPHALDGIIAHLTGFDPRYGKQVDRPTSRMLAKAMEQAGIRQSAAHRKVGHYLLGELLDEGEGWQDFLADHPHVPDTQRRIRVYPLSKATSEEERQSFIRSAQREVILLQGVDHPAIEAPLELIKAQRGPSVVFPHLPDASRLDHWLVEHADELGLLERLNLVRLVAEGLRSAHSKGLFHRALTPRSIVVAGAPAHPEVRIRDWQTAARLHTTSASHVASTTATGRAGSPVIPGGSGTRHVGEHVAREDHLYLAPEILTVPDAAPRTADIFSLGALAILILTGRPPAADLDAKQALLRDPGHLSLAAVADPGLAAALDETLIPFATFAEPTNRLLTVDEFLDELSAAEEQLTSADDVDPLDAKPGDVLDDTWTVVKRFGSGSTAVVLLAETPDGTREVLKVARDDDAAARLADEHDVATRIRDRRRIIDVHGLTTIGGRTVLRMEPAERTLARALADDGPPPLDLLQRWGTDLLEAVAALEDDGLSHRDIKPENIGIAPRGKNDARHLVLFDFSLARANPEDLRAGTAGYLDPFLGEREQRRWDVQAERYAAAVTLHELATGVRPTWGDGSTDPSLLPPEVTTPTLAIDLADQAIREPLTAFFAQALHRDAAARFDTAADMLQAWQRVFAALDGDAAGSPDDDAAAGQVSRRTLPAAEVDLSTVVESTPIAELGLSPRVVSALERLAVETVADLAIIPPAELTRLSGVGGTLRREIVQLAKRLRRHLDASALSGPTPPAGDPATASIDQIARLLVPQRADPEVRTALTALLGLAEDDQAATWPSQTIVAEQTGLDRAAVQRALLTGRSRWTKRVPALTAVRAELVAALTHRGGVASGKELAAALLTSRGSIAQEPWRARRARAVVRAALEAEQSLDAPRMRLRRAGDALLVALERRLEPGGAGEAADDLDAESRFAYAELLGEVADELVAGSWMDEGDDRDPLPPKELVLTSLREVLLPEGMVPLSDARLLRLAAEASAGAALSSRLELYPVGMPAVRALAEARGSLLVRSGLTAQELAARVATRFPAAAPLPGRPELDQLLAEADVPLVWHGSEHRYLPARIHTLGGTATTGTMTSFASPDQRDAAVEAFDRRLRRLVDEGGFVAATVKDRQLRTAADQIVRAMDAERVSLDELLIGEMRRLAHENGAKWTAFEKADADRTSRGWRILEQVAEQAAAAVEAILLQTAGTVVAVDVGLLARYGQMGMLDRLRETLTREDGDYALKALVVVVPGSDPTAKPVVDGVPVPVITTSHWTHVPSAWIELSEEIAA